MVEDMVENMVNQAVMTDQAVIMVKNTEERNGINEESHHRIMGKVVDPNGHQVVDIKEDIDLKDLVHHHQVINQDIKTEIIKLN